jgi:RNA polymerase subunit RPABC4/transcription elongation factor Spt4
MPDEFGCKKCKIASVDEKICPICGQEMEPTLVVIELNEVPDLGGGCDEC